ncbi:MAG: rRNA pseudouridine synthase [Gloeomargaritaceae cyanobacterium C42_A2020_066]|nr:rRNA pseudouridine synthase [Gloeomargaritaceae cyanobacterium C42_A2020_066]
MAKSERLQKVLASRGIASRRHAEALIQAGRVRLNGQVACLGQSADPEQDQIEVDGRPLPPLPEKTYCLLHKPVGVVTTCHDPQGRPTVLSLLPTALTHRRGLHPVGRLDADSSGALLLTNDGDLTLALTHPRHPVLKTYQVWVQGRPSVAALAQWRRGILLDGRPTLPAQVHVLNSQADRTWLEIGLREGRNRQIRRVAAHLGYPVLALHRQAIGEIVLDSQSQPAGHYRPLTETEVAFCQRILRVLSE